MNSNRNRNNNDSNVGPAGHGRGQGQQQPERFNYRPSPGAQVSFRLPRQTDDNKYDSNSQLNQSGPFCTISEAAEEYEDLDNRPRNRRRIFRDLTSFTGRAVRRDANKAKPGTQGNNLFSGMKNGAFNSDSTKQSDSDRRVGPPGRREASFRGKHRSAGMSKAGGGTSRLFSHLGEQANRCTSLFRQESEGSSSSSIGAEQYYIPPPEQSHYSVLDACFQLYSLAFGDVAMWVYGAPFGKVLLFFLMLYMMFVYCFVVLLYLVDKYSTDSACINDGDLSMRSHFEFAFELSWTTFTTVGYGNVGPPSELGCYPIRLMCSIEAILGMAFVSMCSGLFYAKLLRLLAKAPVTFSSTLCVQYGKGLDVGSGNNRKTIKSKKSRSLFNFDDGAIEESDSEDEDEDTMGKMPFGRRRNPSLDNVFHPFPVIEFRIVNNRANHTPGKNEIWDCDVTAIVQLSIENDPHENQEGLDEFKINTSTRWKPPTATMMGKNDKSSQKVYYKIQLKPSTHPYFSRVWFLRHTLDATSPLLRREVRNAIKDNQHGWDPSFDNYRDIRGCLVEFNSLQVILSGASALSRSEVYAEKTYTYEDICVGWRYIAVCYEDRSEKKEGWRNWMRRKNQRDRFCYGDDTTTSVDLSLIHDICPQRGGDFEPVDAGDD